MFFARSTERIAQTLVTSAQPRDFPMTIHPMAKQSRAAAKKRRRLTDRAVGFCAIATIAGLAAIAFASGQYGGEKTSERSQITDRAAPSPTIVPIEEPANAN